MPDHDHADHDHAGHDHSDGDHGGMGPADALSKAMADAAKLHAAPTVPQNSDIDVVVVCDIDCLNSAIFMLRARGTEEDDPVEWHFENVSFVLNVIDSLAGDDRLIEIRKHRPIYRTLTKVEEKMPRSRTKPKRRSKTQQGLRESPRRSAG